MTRRRGWL